MRPREKRLRLLWEMMRLILNTVAVCDSCYSNTCWRRRLWSTSAARASIDRVQGVILMALSVTMRVAALDMKKDPLRTRREAKRGIYEGH